MKRLGVLALMSLLGAVVLAAPSSAVDGDFVLDVAPNRIQLTSRAGDSVSTETVDVSVKTPIAAQMTVSLFDAVVDESGSWVKAPLGSTSYSLGSTVSLKPSTAAIDPSAELVRLPVELAMPVNSMDQPRVGILAVQVIPDPGVAGEGVNVTQAIEIDTPVVAEPSRSALTGDANVKVSLEGTGLTVERTESLSVIDSTIPDVLSSFIDHGPVTTTAHYKNNGDFVVDAQTTFVFSSVGPMAMLPGNTDAGDPFYTVNDTHHYALPRQSAIAETTSFVEANGIKGDSLPFIGFVKVTATTTGTLGPLAAAPVVQSTVFLVFPWKEALALLLVIVLWVLFKRWRRNRRDRRNEPPPASEVREPVESVT